MKSILMMTSLSGLLLACSPSVTPPSTSQPSAEAATQSGLTLSEVTDNSFILSWGAVPEAVKYEVSKVTSGKKTVLGSTTKTKVKITIETPLSTQQVDMGEARMEVEAFDSNGFSITVVPSGNNKVFDTPGNFAFSDNFVDQ